MLDLEKKSKRRGKKAGSSKEEFIMTHEWANRIKVIRKRIILLLPALHILPFGLQCLTHLFVKMFYTN